MKVEINDEKLAGGTWRLLDLILGLTADELALTLPSPPGEGILGRLRKRIPASLVLSPFFDQITFGWTAFVQPGLAECDVKSEFDARDHGWRREWWQK